MIEGGVFYKSTMSKKENITVVLFATDFFPTAHSHTNCVVIHIPCESQDRYLGFKHHSLAVFLGGWIPATPKHVVILTGILGMRGLFETIHHVDGRNPAFTTWDV